MKKAVLAALSALTIAVASLATATDADAQRRHRGDGGAVAAGIIGGLAAGAIIGGAIASSGPAYGAPAYGGPVYYHDPAPVYVAPPPPRCYWTRGEPMWDDYRGVWRRPRIQVCD